MAFLHPYDIKMLAELTFKRLTLKTLRHFFLFRNSFMKKPASGMLSRFHLTAEIDSEKDI